MSMSMRRQCSRSSTLARAATRALTCVLLVGLPLSGAGGEAVIAGAALTIGSNPVGAAVYVDGILVGQTPLTVERLAAGDHRVRLEKDGYIENSRIVSIAVGQTGAVQIDLTRGMARGIRKQAEDEPGTVVAKPVKKGGAGKTAVLIIGGLALAGGAALLARSKDAAPANTAPENKAPVLTGATATPGIALQAVTSVAFNAVGASDPDGDTLMYAWNFGDGETGTGPNPTHTYTSPGTFTVRLVVGDGKQVATASTSVVVRSMTGRWSATYNIGNRLTFDLTQNGTDLTGSFERVYYNTECLAEGESITSASVTAPLHVSITVQVPTRCIGSYAYLGFEVVVNRLECDLDATMNACTGQWEHVGSVFTPWRLTLSRVRQ